MKQNNLSLCKGDVCVKTDGQLAKGIAGAAMFALICAGLAKLLR
ncbi:hypothetical protein [Aureispira sp. CCB-QB1]|nr:hypothetical protein [Aureispira sp. CCB-QB1]